MLTGKLPYADINDIDALKSAMCSLKQVNLPKEANKLPRGFRKALGAMLQVDPELRPSIEQVLILIRESDSIVSSISKSKKKSNQSQIALPIAKITALPQTQPQVLDENTRISLALVMVATNPSKSS
jgi:serine/threonine protein kinase